MQSDQQQVPFTTDKHSRELQFLMESNCQHTEVPHSLAHHSMANAAKQAESALLQFMIAATPKMHLARDILDRFSDYLSETTLSTVHHLLPEDGHHMPSMEIHNVPDTVNPVKARMAYIQVPNTEGTGTSLQLVYKFEVEMQDNWYEAAVSALPPHTVISVVDWASDSPMPVRLPETAKDEKTPTKYMVFKWGINDPSEGNRTLEEENFDPIASPEGWHALPVDNDPSANSRNVAPTKKWRYTNTTAGNNVCLLFLLPTRLSLTRIYSGLGS